MTVSVYCIYYSVILVFVFERNNLEDLSIDVSKIPTQICEKQAAKHKALSISSREDSP